MEVLNNFDFKWGDYSSSITIRDTKCYMVFFTATKVRIVVPGCSVVHKASSLELNKHRTILENIINVSFLSFNLDSLHF